MLLEPILGYENKNKLKFDHWTRRLLKAEKVGTRRGTMDIIYINQWKAYRQVEAGIRCPLCGEEMEVIQHKGHWYLECKNCVTTFGSFIGCDSGGFDSRQEAVEAYLTACKDAKQRWKRS